MVTEVLVDEELTCLAANTDAPPTRARQPPDG
jgi:hypothetical protein